MKIVLTSVGNYPPPYLHHCLSQIRHYDKDIEVVLLTDQLIKYNEWAKYDVELKLVCGRWLDSIKEVSPHKGLKSPNGYEENDWLFGTCARIFAIADYLEVNDQSLYHLESDVLLYTSLSELDHNFRQLTQFSCLRATLSHISLAFSYIPSYRSIVGVCEHILSEYSKSEEFLLKKYETTPTEMVILSKFNDLYILPSCNTDFGYGQFGAYDPAAIGQFLAGRHGHENDESWCEDRHFLGAKFKSKEWTPVFQDGEPFIRDNTGGLLYKLNSLHMHEKSKMSLFLSGDK